MYRWWRAVDASFSHDEQLYVRCKAEWLDENNQLKLANVHFPDQSTNRQKYSKLCDVLLPSKDPKSHDWIYWGVMAFAVADVPTKGESGEGKNLVHYDFSVEHDPDDDNYGHTELRVYKNKVRERDKGKINNTVKKEYRAQLARCSRLMVAPLDFPPAVE